VRVWDAVDPPMPLGAECIARLLFCRCRNDFRQAIVVTYPPTRMAVR
jgi:hypothetical protein